MSTSTEEIAHLIKQHPRLVIAEDYEIAIQRYFTSGRKFKNGKLNFQYEEENTWVSLRLLHRKQPGKSSLTLHSNEALPTLVDSAFESARRASVDPYFRFPLWRAPKNHTRSETETEFKELQSQASTLARLPESIEEVLEQWDIETLLLRKSEKFLLRHRNRVQVSQISVFEQRNGTPTSLREERASSLGLMDYAERVRDLVDQSYELQQASDEPVEGSGPLLFSPQVNAAILRRLAPYFFANHVQNGKSPLTRSSENSPFSSVITLVDDGNYEGGAQTMPFDMEGVLSQSTLLVQQGKVVDYLYDTCAATRENRLSTGNFLRPPQEPHSRVGASTFFILPSKVGRAQLVDLLGNGLFIQNLKTLEPLFQTNTHFLLQGVGWRICGGKFHEPLSHIEVEVDLFEMFKGALYVGSDLEFFGSFGAPSIFYDFKK